MDNYPESDVEESSRNARQLACSAVYGMDLCDHTECDECAFYHKNPNPNLTEEETEWLIDKIVWLIKEEAE